MNKWTEEQLADFKANTIANMGEPAGVFTCDSCGYRFNCQSVYDWYNTNGDCLEEK